MDKPSPSEALRRIVNFCWPNLEDIEAMTDDEIADYLVEEGISSEEVFEKLKKVMKCRRWKQ